MQPGRFASGRQRLRRCRFSAGSLDARKKPALRWVYTVDVTLRTGEGAVLRRDYSGKITRETPYVYHIPRCTARTRPVVVGFGPAGMFAALVLARAGLRPIVLERGDPAPQRREKVEAFWRGGPLDPECNVQFGEGGAGTFSDGKLNTSTKNERGRWVLQQLVGFGAQEEILYDAKPHVGTDVLFQVVQNLRRKVLELGGEVRFGAKLTGLAAKDGRLTRRDVCTGGDRGSLVLPGGDPGHWSQRPGYLPLASCRRGADAAEELCHGGAHRAPAEPDRSESIRHGADAGPATCRL